MKALLALLLLLPIAACSPSSPLAASPVHEWLNYYADSWLSEQEPDGEWSSSGGSGGGGSGGFGGSKMRYTSHSRIRGRVPKEERSALLAGFRAEIERQIVAKGGSVQGTSLSGTEENPVAWGFDYEATGGARGGVNVDAVHAEDGWLVVILTTYEVR